MTNEFSRFVEPAKAYSQTWRLALGILAALMIYILWIAGSAIVLWVVVGTESLGGYIAEIDRPKTPTAALMFFSTFIGMGVGAWVAVRALHHRSGLTLIGPARPALINFCISAGIVGSVVLFFTFVLRPDYVFQPYLAPAIWLSFLPMALACLIIQTGAEEVVFRGYLTQQLAAKFSSPLIWFALPAVIFSILHYDPSAGANAWAIVAAALIFGLMAADLTHLTGNLGAAWGFHFANNIFAVTLVAMDGGITGLALYTTPFTVENADVLFPLILRDMGVLILAWVILRFTLKRRLPKAA